MQHVYARRYAHRDNIRMAGVAFPQLHGWTLLVRLLVQVGVFHLVDVSTVDSFKVFDVGWVGIQALKMVLRSMSDFVVARWGI